MAAGFREIGSDGERVGDGARAGRRRSYPTGQREGVAAGGGSGGERPRTGERTKKKNRYGHDRWQAGNFEKEIDPLVF